MEDFVSYAPAVPPAPTFAAPLPAVRARLWLPGRTFAPEDEYPRLWLSLSDGRVLALRLGQARLGEDAVIAPIVAALADDAGGHRYQLELPDVGFVQVLYAAPALPNPSRWHAGFWFDADFQRFAATLDAEAMRLLLWLEREPTPPAVTRHDGRAPQPAPKVFFASVRNYNRLATLPPLLRERRMQALMRFPALVAPVLLTLHHSPNVFDGKRHAWRDKDVAVEAAIDAGGISPGRSPRTGASRADSCARRSMPPSGEGAKRPVGGPALPCSTPCPTTSARMWRRSSAGCRT